MAKTAIVEARVDLRNLAEILLFMKSQGEPPKTKSELVRSSIMMLAELLRDRGLTRTVESTAEALEIFTGEGLGNPNHMKRGSKALSKALAEEMDVEIERALGRVRPSG